MLAASRPHLDDDFGSVSSGEPQGLTVLAVPERGMSAPLGMLRAMLNDRWQYRVTCTSAKAFDTEELNSHVKKSGDAGWELTAATVASYQVGPSSSFTLQLVHTLYWRKPQGVGYALRPRLPSAHRRRRI